MLFLHMVFSKTEEKLAKHTVFNNGPWENRGNLLKIIVWQIFFVDGTQGKQSKTYSEMLFLHTVLSKTEVESNISRALLVVLVHGPWQN